MTGIERLRALANGDASHETGNGWFLTAETLWSIAGQIERETERTCRDKNGGQKSMGFECTRCETQCEHIYNMCTGEIDLPTYCPGCGAKVVME